MATQIDVVCGTYNRLKALQRMIESVRHTLPAHLTVRFLIADNASDDGTMAWLQEQRDVTALQMGAPVGAIKAFTEAGKQATAKYTLIATDDIYFPARAIVRAFTHLETNPHCGAVTFKHNKRREEFKEALALVTHSNGRQEWKPYTQICLVRTTLAHDIGWWGGDDPVMGKGFTYGGDNFLSAGIWEAGYTVDAVDGVHNIEDVFDDTARKMNEDRHLADSALYWQLYPTIRIPETKADAPDTEQLRVLLLLHYSPTHKHHRAQKQWMRYGLEQHGLVWDYDFAGAHARGRDITQELRMICQDWQPHLIVSQIHQPSHGFDADTARTIRHTCPTAVMVNWNGDVWQKNILNQGTQHILRHYDLCLFSNAQLTRDLATMGNYTTGFLPEGYEPIEIGIDGKQPSHDVLFTGNAYSEWRINLMQTLRGMPYDVGLYGRARDVQMNGETMWNWSVTRGLYHNAKLVISDQQFPDARGYVSKRLWEILASGGGLALQQYSEELDDLTGLRDGVHYVAWHTLEDLQTKIDYYLAHESERQAIAYAGQQRALSQHTPTKRIKWLLGYVEKLWVSEADLLQKTTP